MESAKQEKEYQESIINKSEALSKITPETLLIIVDTHKRSYVEVPELLEETSKIAIIDHHRKVQTLLKKQFFHSMKYMLHQPVNLLQKY